MRTYIGLVWAIARKDLLVEFRTLERLTAMGAFVVLIGILFNFSIDTTVVRPQDIAAGLIWMTIIFGGMLGMGRTFSLEEQDGALTGILQSPIPLDALYLGKVLGNFVLLSVMVALVFLVFGMFFGLTFAGSLVSLVGVVASGVLGFVALTTLFSAMTTRSSMGEGLLPVLIFPLLVPVIVNGTTATNRLFAGRPFAEVDGNLRMLAAFAIGSTVVGAWLFRFVIEE
ncbi:MAG: heme exporter protein CcmB [Gemmatimonadetes bacterium]|nr:heme exporter protein CcmB [Gemmatimonadota bacterium]